jgi:hypothetical protein
MSVSAPNPGGFFANLTALLAALVFIGFAVIPVFIQPVERGPRVASIVVAVTIAVFSLSRFGRRGS